MNKKTETTKRIPIGTTVTSQAVAGYGPKHTGVVQSFDPAGYYEILVTTTPTGKLRKKPVTMRPYASRLEAQNPQALKKV